MKTYTVLVKITNGDNSTDVKDFIHGEFTRVNIKEILGVTICKYRFVIEVEDDFDFGYFEDCMDNAGYDTELLWED